MHLLYYRFHFYSKHHVIVTSITTPFFNDHLFQNWFQTGAVLLVYLNLPLRRELKVNAVTLFMYILQKFVSLLLNKSC